MCPFHCKKPHLHHGQGSCSRMQFSFFFLWILFPTDECPFFFNVAFLSGQKSLQSCFGIFVDPSPQFTINDNTSNTQLVVYCLVYLRACRKKCFANKKDWKISNATMIKMPIEKRWTAISLLGCCARMSERVGPHVLCTFRFGSENVTLFGKKTCLTLWASLKVPVCSDVSVQLFSGHMHMFPTVCSEMHATTQSWCAWAGPTICLIFLETLSISLVHITEKKQNTATISPS